MLRKTLLLLACAALLATEPLQHQHPLIGPNPAGTCVVCAAGVNRLSDPAPSVSAPSVVVYALIATTTVSFLTGVVVTSEPRGPPAAA